MTRRSGHPVPIDYDEMRVGIEHEMEHTDDPVEAAKIACDHLQEMPDYYTRLKAMERRAERGLGANRRKLPWYEQKIFGIPVWAALLAGGAYFVLVGRKPIQIGRSRA